MDSLFVEEVAASLVREFLSRKVRGAPSAAQGSCSNLGAPWGLPCSLCPFGEGDLPLPATYPSGARQRLHFPGLGWGELRFPGPLSVPAHFPQAGPHRSHPPGACPFPASGGGTWLRGDGPAPSP